MLTPEDQKRSDLVSRFVSRLTNNAYPVVEQSYYMRKSRHTSLAVDKELEMKRLLANLSRQDSAHVANQKQSVIQYHKTLKYLCISISSMSACIIELLPLELLEWILLYCQNKSIAVALPRVSKYFRQLTGEDEGVWKAKCGELNLDLAKKSPEQTWKHYFYTSTCLKLLRIIIN